jgi:hypothetical protein
MFFVRLGERQENTARKTPNKPLRILIEDRLDKQEDKIDKK